MKIKDLKDKIHYFGLEESIKRILKKEEKLIIELMNEKISKSIFWERRKKLIGSILK